jgi:hypothetical protein
MHEKIVGKSECKGLLGRCTGRWEDNIKTDIKKVVCEGEFL